VLAGLAVGEQCIDHSGCTVIGKTHTVQWTSKNSVHDFVVCIHALGLSPSAYKPLARELAANGVDGCAINIRGFGPHRRTKGQSRLDLVETTDDITKLLRAIKVSYPDYRLFLLGESMGGALALRVAAKNPDLITGVIASAPGFRLHRISSTAVKGIFEVITSYGDLPGPAGKAVIKQTTQDPVLASHILTDPTYRLRLTVGEAAKYVHFISRTPDFSSKLKTPVLLIHGLHDRLANVNGTAQIFSRIPTDQKEFIVDARGEHLLLEEGQYSPQLLKIVLQWLKQPEKSLHSENVRFTVVDGDKLDAGDTRQIEKLRKQSGVGSS
jgi:alpha-beta hydrolase superfamily lysophospholipase